MDNSKNLEIKEGQIIEIRIGRNTVKVAVIAAGDVLLNVRNPKTGKTFSITKNRVARILDETEAPEAQTPETPAPQASVSYPMVDEAVARAQQCADRLAASVPTDDNDDNDEPEPEEHGPGDAGDCEAASCGEDEHDGGENACDESANSCAGTSCDDNRQPEASAEETEQKYNAKPEADEQPRKKLSLLDAAYSVLAESKTPLNTKELVRLAIERGFWTPTACATPEQSLYGAIFREIKEKEHPRFRRSEKRKGAFEAEA